jgi:hypothetical protein
MKAQINYVLACEYALIDNSGKVTASGIFSRLKNLNGVSPFLYSFYVVGAVLIHEVSVTGVTVQLIDPNGKIVSNVILSPTIHNTLADDNEDKINIVAKFNSEFSNTGKYGVNILINGEIVYQNSEFLSYKTH